MEIQKSLMIRGLTGMVVVSSGPFFQQNTLKNDVSDGYIMTNELYFYVITYHRPNQN